MDTREVKFHRVVSIVEKRSLMHWPDGEYERGFHDDQWHGDHRNYKDAREYHDEGSYPPDDRQYFDEDPNFGNFRRNSSSPRNEGPFAQQYYGRDDLRHQLDSRNNSRPGPYFRSRGRGRGLGRPRRPDKKAKEHYDDFRTSPPVVSKHDRSPARREAQPPSLGCSGSNSSNKSLSPDMDSGHAHQPAQQRNKVNVLMSHTPSDSAEGSSNSLGSSKEKPPASVEETEEVVAASVEPKLTPEVDLKTRRLEAIKAKALEIEKHYRQDCETFRMVVKMLVAKEPSLDKLLQAPLDENLLEIKQRCLDSLRHFVKGLDEELEQPDTSA